MMIVEYAKYGLVEETLKLHQQMEHLVIGQDEYPLVSVLSAYACLPDIQHGRKIHAFKMKGVLSRTFLWRVPLLTFMKNVDVSRMLGAYLRR